MGINDLEHPDITSALYTGYPTWIDPLRVPRCPCCGEECETLYKDQQGIVYGCDSCISTLDAWGWMEKEENAWN